MVTLPYTSIRNFDFCAADHEQNRKRMAGNRPTPLQVKILDLKQSLPKLLNRLCHNLNNYRQFNILVNKSFTHLFLEQKVYHL